jgi:hypothetical protein
MVGIAVAGGVMLSAAGPAAAAPDNPDLTLAHFVKAGTPVFTAPNGDSGALYHSQRANEAVVVRCAIAVNFADGATATTYASYGTFGSPETRLGYVQDIAVTLPDSVGNVRPCGFLEAL